MTKEIGELGPHSQEEVVAMKRVVDTRVAGIMKESTRENPLILDSTGSMNLAEILIQSSMITEVLNLIGEAIGQGLEAETEFGTTQEAEML